MGLKAYGVLFLSILVLGVSSLQGLEAQKFYSDDPHLVDDEELDVPEQPAEIKLSDMYDRFGHMVNYLGASPIGSEAQNVNTLDEVPDSGWFVNRHRKTRSSLEELAKGPHHGSGPYPNETWTVFRSKTQGLTPGFQILDEKGERYVIKLDPVDVPELASAAEVIATIFGPAHVWRCRAALTLRGSSSRSSLHQLRESALEHGGARLFEAERVGLRDRRHRARQSGKVHVPDGLRD